MIPPTTRANLTIVRDLGAVLLSSGIHTSQRNHVLGRLSIKLEATHHAADYFRQRGLSPDHLRHAPDQLRHDLGQLGIQVT